MSANKDEQNLASVRATLPRLWWNVYQGLLDQGFEKDQAFAVLQAYVLGMGAGKVMPPSSAGPDSDKPED